MAPEDPPRDNEHDLRDVLTSLLVLLALSQEAGLDAARDALERPGGQPPAPGPRRPA